MNSLSASSLFNFRRGSFLKGNRNTLPDFESDDYLNGHKVSGGSIYEVKAKNGGLYLSTNLGQMRGHIDNIVAKHIGTLGFKPSVHLITTSDTRLSLGIKTYSFFSGVKYYHKTAYFKTNGSNYKFTFR